MEVQGRAWLATAACVSDSSVEKRPGVDRHECEYRAGSGLGEAGHERVGGRAEREPIRSLGTGWKLERHRWMQASSASAGGADVWGARLRSGVVHIRSRLGRDLEISKLRLLGKWISQTGACWPGPREGEGEQERRHRQHTEGRDGLRSVGNVRALVCTPCLQRPRGSSELSSRRNRLRAGPRCLGRVFAHGQPLFGAAVGDHGDHLGGDRVCGEASRAAGQVRFRSSWCEWGTTTAGGQRPQ